MIRMHTVIALRKSARRKKSIQDNAPALVTDVATEAAPTRKGLLQDGGRLFARIATLMWLMVLGYACMIFLVA